MMEIMTLMMMMMIMMMLPDEAPSTRDTMLSYLPMCYTLERCCQLVTVLGGGDTSRRIIDSSNNAAGQAWKDQYVRSLVSVAGVWGGTARAVKVFAVGDNLDSWFLNEKNLLWERTNPSLAWLMPSADFWTDDEVSFTLHILLERVIRKIFSTIFIWCGAPSK